jgi:hypothetical protein
MARPGPDLTRRLAARLVTGPVGFFAAGIVDWLVLVSRYAAARARGRRHDWYAE